MTDYKGQIEEYLQKEMQIISELDKQGLSDAMNALEEARLRGARIYIMGNGGSAATASHFVCDFNKGVWEGKGGARFQFQCLSDNTPIMTAIANDSSYEDVFVYQLKGILKKDDLVVAISGSGNSANVINAVKYAKEVGCPVIALTGYHGGKLKDLADYSMHVPVDDMQITEDIHMIFDHMMMKIFSK